MISKKNRILYYILALLILISSVVTLLTQPTKNEQKVDSSANYIINTAPLQEYEQGHIDSH